MSGSSNVRTDNDRVSGFSNSSSFQSSFLFCTQLRGRRILFQNKKCSAAFELFNHCCSHLSPFLHFHFFSGDSIELDFSVGPPVCNSMVEILRSCQEFVSNLFPSVPSSEASSLPYAMCIVYELCSLRQTKIHPKIRCA